ncbi:MAG: heme exporter protein CcmD [Hyphomicrobiales bacterium]|nr:heme exporter protein CcmD [Hyphomicrobiales bacterium]
MNNPHTTFIVASYAITAVAVLGTIAAIMLDYRRLRRALEKLGAPVDQRADEG